MALYCLSRSELAWAGRYLVRCIPLGRRSVSVLSATVVVIVEAVGARSEDERVKEGEFTSAEGAWSASDAGSGLSCEELEVSSCQMKEYEGAIFNSRPSGNA